MSNATVPAALCPNRINLVAFRHYLEPFFAAYHPTLGAPIGEGMAHLQRAGLTTKRAFSLWVWALKQGLIVEIRHNDRYRQAAFA